MNEFDNTNEQPTQRKKSHSRIIFRSVDDRGKNKQKQILKMFEPSMEQNIDLNKRVIIHTALGVRGQS